MIEPQANSYKDPSASVLYIEGKYYRYIFQEYKSEYDHLMDSGLYQELTSEGLLIPHQEVNRNVDAPNLYKVILPSQIEFQSYPYEWSFGQWASVIKTFLRISIISMRYGMILKDATPYNFVIKGNSVTLFDTTSFTFFKSGAPWMAYRQFCEEMLGPLSLMYYRDFTWGRLSVAQLRGLSVAFISKHLPVRSWMNITCLVHLHLHSKFTHSRGQGEIGGEVRGFESESLLELFSQLESSVDSWSKRKRKASQWSAYYENDIESPLYLEEKQIILNKWIEGKAIDTVVDLGANTGLFSFQLAKYCDRIIAVDSDPNCVDIIQSKVDDEAITNLTALTSDLAEPGPSLGLLNKETKSFLERAKSDLALGLALVHHLSISKNIPLLLVADLFSVLAMKYAVVEFIPKSDKKLKILLAGKSITYQNYNEEQFVAAFERHFTILQIFRYTSSERSLYFLGKK